MRPHRFLCVFVLFAGAVVPGERRAAAADFAFEEKADRLIITDGGQPVATYVFSDEQITKPYFMHVHAPGGVRVTRNQPPITGKDLDDHPVFHPGIWAFGNFSGQDVWRNKARIVHERFVEKPAGGSSQAGFAAENRCVAEDGKTVLGRETARYTFLARPAGYLLIWDSTFRSDGGLYFEDSKHTGFCVRVATPIAVNRGGTILDAAGRRNEREVMGKSAEWCDYSGIIDGRHAGITVMCDPKNIGPSEYFARDYGLLMAKPFKSKVVVKPGESLRLRYGVLLHSGPKDTAPDLKAAYADFLSKL